MISFRLPFHGPVLLRSFLHTRVTCAPALHTRYRDFFRYAITPHHTTLHCCYVYALPARLPRSITTHTALVTPHLPLYPTRFSSSVPPRSACGCLPGWNTTYRCTPHTLPRDCGPLTLHTRCCRCLRYTPVLTYTLCCRSRAGSHTTCTRSPADVRFPASSHRTFCTATVYCLRHTATTHTVGYRAPFSLYRRARTFTALHLVCLLHRYHGFNICGLFHALPDSTASPPHTPPAFTTSPPCLHYCYGSRTVLPVYRLGSTRMPHRIRFCRTDFHMVLAPRASPPAAPRAVRLLPPRLLHARA